MDAPEASLADARNNMVDGQLRPNRVNDSRVLEAMRRLRREVFLPAGRRALAYADVEVEMAPGRFMLPPMAVAKLIQAAELPAQASVLVLGAGYAAAVLAGCGARVTVVEQDPVVLAQARVGLAGCGAVVAFAEGDLADGWAESAPYDCIFVDGAVRHMPALAAQLRDEPPGRICAVVAPQGRRGIAMIAERAGHGLAQRPLFDCTASVMREFDTPARFEF